MNASSLLQVLLWCGHRRKAITDILFHSIYSQKSVCNLVADWLKLSPYGSCCSAKKKRKKKVQYLNRKEQAVCASTWSFKGVLAHFHSYLNVHVDTGDGDTEPRFLILQITALLQVLCVIYKEKKKKVNADLHQCPMRNAEGLKQNQLENT